LKVIVAKVVSYWATFVSFLYEIVEFSRLINRTTKMKSLLVFALAALAVLTAAKEEKKDDIGTVIGIDLGTTYSW
jgi:hypothetical protein